MSKMDFAGVISSINQAESALSEPLTTDSEQCEQLRQACGKLASRLETPLDRLRKVAFGCYELPFLKLAIDTGIFDLFNKNHESLAEFSVSEIATHTNVDQLLTSRIVRFLTAVGVFDVSPEGKIKGTRFSQSVMPKSIVHDSIVLSGLYAAPFVRLPAYLEENKYKIPDNGSAGPFQYGLNTDLHFFDWLDNHKLEREAFHRIMEASKSSTSAEWTEYLSEDRIQKLVSSQEQKVEKEAPFTFVDIGGGYGHELEAFMTRCPDLVGRFILQDVSALKDQNTFTDSTASSYCQEIERMAHNFFDDQPIQGAEVYLLARVLHDWPNMQARQILSHIHTAMSSKSVLFVFERVFPDAMEKTNLGDVVNDATMMAIFASLERSESQFKELFDSVGLKLIHVWRRHGAEDDFQAVLEITRN